MSCQFTNLNFLGFSMSWPIRMILDPESTILQADKPSLVSPESFARKTKYSCAKISL